MNSNVANPLPRFGERILLRRFVPTDIERFQNYRHDVDVGLYQGWSPMGNTEAMMFIVKMQFSVLFQPGIWTQIAIAEVQTNDLVGDIGICVDSEQRRAEIGFTLQRQAQGRGIGTEAVNCAIAMLFEHTQITQVRAITDSRNLASMRLLRRVGMREITTQPAVFKGAPCMETIFSVTRRDGV